ncbi:MAG: hypothetical protein LBE35_02095 [Clostridiales bacterium]|jgi:hypothetical protein|nr:hypothetical protein [Clostridiales bacterium]
MNTVSYELMMLKLEGINIFKGEFATESALQTAYPMAEMADFAYVTATNSFWAWNTGLTTPAWVNLNIEETQYLLLADAAKAAVNYLVVPDMEGGNG